eukprot:952915_1
MRSIPDPTMNLRPNCNDSHEIQMTTETNLYQLTRETSSSKTKQRLTNTKQENRLNVVMTVLLVLISIFVIGTLCVLLPLHWHIRNNAVQGRRPWPYQSGAAVLNVTATAHPSQVSTSGPTGPPTQRLTEQALQLMARDGENQDNSTVVQSNGTVSDHASKADSSESKRTQHH